MAEFDKTYKDLIGTILKKGKLQNDPNRKGTQRLNIPSYTLRHENKDGFPALTLRKVSTKLAWAELSFFLSGSTDIRELWKRGVNFWDKDTANFHGVTEQDFKKLKQWWKQGEEVEGLWYEMGRIYPYQYRSFAGEFDQIEYLVQELQENPLSSSLVVSAWNPDDSHLMCLRPCHYGFQIVVSPLELKYRLSSIINHKDFNEDEFVKLRYEYPDDTIKGIRHRYADKLGIVKYGFEVHWNQRSTDSFLGTAINVQYYHLLGMVLEKLTGHKFLAVQGDLKNVHLYDNSIQAAEALLLRSDDLPSPKVEIIGEIDYNNLKIEQLVVKDYQHHGELKVEMKAYT